MMSFYLYLYLWAVEVQSLVKKKQVIAEETAMLSALFLNLYIVVVTNRNNNDIILFVFIFVFVGC